MQVEHDSTLPLNLIRPRRPVLDVPADVDYVVELSAHSEANFYAGLSDEQPPGVFVPTYRQHPVGSLVTIALSVPGRDDLIVTTTLVRWHREASESSDAFPGMGVEFLALSARARSEVNKFCERRPPLLHELD